MADATVFADAWFDVGQRNQKQMLTGLDFYQEKYCHEYAVLHVRRPDTDQSKVFRAGSPVIVRWGRKNTMENSFFGYCADTRGHYDRKRPQPALQMFEIPVLGASMMLKQVFTHTWENVTAEQIVRQIAQSVRFSVDITNADMVIRRFSSPGWTGWRTLCELAKLTGNVLLCRNTMLYFIDPLTLIKRKGGTSPTFQTQRIGMPETIVEFTPKGGDLTTGDGTHKANRSLYGVDATTVARFQAEASPDDIHSSLAAERSPTLLDELETHMVGDNAAWAQAQVQGAVRRNQLPMRANAVLAGNSRVAPAGGVMLAGVGTKHSGLWSVEKVHHKVSHTNYHMIAELSRDSSTATGSMVSSNRRVIRARMDPFGSQVAVEPNTILVNQVWRSQWSPQKAVTGVE